MRNYKLLFGSIIRTLRYNASIRSNKSRFDSRKLEAYLRVVLNNKQSQLIPADTNKIKISNIIKMGGGFVNQVHSFLLKYTERGEEKQLPLIIKTYRDNVDPVRQAHARYIHNQDLRMCVREWQALRSLERVGFAVPKAYLNELDSRILGYPFLIMAKTVSIKKNSSDYLDRYAASLADLHNIAIGKLELENLKPPKDDHAFARRWPIHFKHVLNIETKHSAQHKRDFDFTIRWLESNVSNNFCPKYSLIHGDSHPGNALLTKDSKITLIDWDSVDIGDPAFDVANAYHTIKFFNNPKDPDSAEQIAERFISEYLKKFKGDIRSRLKFYQVVTMLGYSIAYSSGLSSPMMAYKYHQRKVLNSVPFLKMPFILLVFPFLRWSFVARQIQAEGDLDWLKYFENFKEKLILN